VGTQSRSESCGEEKKPCTDVNRTRTLQPVARSPSITVIIIIQFIFKMLASNTALFQANTNMHNKYN
jgi:hypothetical protein